MNVVFLDVGRKPSDYQRIYLPKKIIKDEKIPLCSAVKLTLSVNYTLLCKVFVDEIESRRFYKMGTDVSNVIDFEQFQNGNGMSVLKIESLEYSQSPLNIVLKLVCSDLKTYAKLTHDSNENKMSEILDEILHGIKFLPGYLINLKHHLIGELYGISGIFVESVNNVFLYTDKSIFEIRQKGATKYTVSSIITKERFVHIEESKKLLPTNIGGMTSQIYELSRVFHGTLGINRRRGILLCGPSGSGKTTCLKQVSRSANAFLINVSANEFFGSREGESEGIIRSIFDQAKLNATEGLTVIYIQNIELLNGTTTDKNPKSSMGRNLLQFTHILDDLAKNPNNNLVVVASTQNVVNVHQSLRRPGRLDSEIHFGVPKFSQRLEMINYLMPSLKEAEWLSEMTLGYLPADLELLISHAKMEALHRNAPYLGKEDLSTALKFVTPSCFKGGLGHISINIDDGAPDLNSIRGLEDVKLQLRRSIQWPLEHPEAFIRMGIKCPRGILLYGPPGCGKTSLARAFAKDNNGGKNVSFLSVSGASIFSPFVGDSEKNIVEIFRKARLGAPCVLFIDEIDTLVCKRGQKSQGNVQERILSTLLNEMDGLENLIQPLSYNEYLKLLKEGDGEVQCNVSAKNKVYDSSDVIVIGATNRPEALDSALIRPGRFDAAIYVPLPDLNGRLDILRHKTSKIPLSSDVDLVELSSKTEHLSGADLEGLCREAALEAVTSEGLDDCTNVGMIHFRKALESMRPSITNEMLKKFDDLNRELQYHKKGRDL
ncbi:uncharacterized protein [Lepeophtheirus salmonis]|uniref:uncharacterized protein n=1 Tax=Lepeophtheirus salmonis TaxID=72036 RepID=UPI001AE951BB|nr:spermatogenesis-associated protein 5-like protein 1 [Lepeophtheirus salmonis]